MSASRGRKRCSEVVLAGLVAATTMAVIAFQDARPKGPHLETLYFGQPAPGPTPQIFAPGIVSSPEQGETTPIFSADGREVFFSRFEMGHRAVIMTARLQGTQWTAPTPIWSSDDIFDTKPSLADGGRLLLFASTRPIEGRPGVNRATRPGCVNLWYAERAASGWSAPRPFGPAVNTEADEDLPLAGPDRFVYFIRSSKSGYHQFRYPLPTAADAPPAAEPVEEFVTGVVTSLDLHGRFALYQGMREDAPGRGVGVVFRQDDGRWGKGMGLGARLDEAGAFAPVASPDGRYIFFMSDRSGNGDVYWVEAPETFARRLAQPRIVFARSGPPSGAGL